VLTELGAASDDPAIREAALRHREELSASLTQARRLEFVVERFRGILPWAGLLFAGLLVYLASRVAKYTARYLARPVRDLAGWAEAVGRGEPLPAGPAEPDALRDEFAVLRDAFRGMEREIVAARARAVEAERDRARAQMARQVAHELKNPLTPMRFALRRLSASGADGDAEAIAVLEAETARLDRLARAFSQYGALPEGPPSEIDLVEMLEYLIRTHLAEGVGRLEVQPGATTVITGRYEPLARALANLLLNAGEVASGSPGSVQVTLGDAGDGVRIIVQDDGPGLPPGRDIWEPGVTSKEGGSGLGLAIVRRRSWPRVARSRPGRAPRGAPASASPFPPPELRRGGRGSMPTVLIADDEPNLRRMLASLLRAEGYRTREASRGDDAVAAVQEEEPDVLLLDLVMPGWTGSPRWSGSTRWRPPSPCS
jgi:nitrogen fixation/metabolism regulation signal transduction histidine kinase